MLKYTICLFLALVNVGSVIGDPEQIDIGSASFHLDGKKNRIYNKIQTVASKTKSGKLKLTIGFKEEDSYFFITIKIDEDKIKNREKISSKYHDIKFVYRSVDGDYLVEPSYIYFPGDNKGNSLKDLRKSQKIATGVGVIENYKMKGTEFIMDIDPNYTKNRLIEIRCNFYGKIKFTTKSDSKIVDLINGELYSTVIHTKD